MFRKYDENAVREQSPNEVGSIESNIPEPSAETTEKRGVWFIHDVSTILFLNNSMNFLSFLTKQTLT